MVSQNKLYLLHFYARNSKLKADYEWWIHVLIHTFLKALVFTSADLLRYVRENFWVALTSQSQIDTFCWQEAVTAAARIIKVLW
jgi:hypothetical protein